jgi:hypothetical protein
MERSLVSRASCCFTLLTLSLALPDARAQAPVVDTLAIKAHTYFLAHDLLRGRAAGTRDAQLAALYIASQCRTLGLTPLGDEYLQVVPLERASIGSGSSLTLTSPRGHVAFGYPTDFLPNVGAQPTLVDFAGLAVFAGSEREITRGALGNADVRGRVVVTAGLVRGAAADTLVARGAAAMLHLIPDQETFELYVRSRGPTRLYHRDSAVRSSFLPRLPSVIGGPRVAGTLLSAATLNRDGKPLPQLLDWTVGVELALETEPVDDVNVGCRLRGTAARDRDTAVVLTAHYDHLGVSVPDASGDSVYNGFSDNAAGVGMLLAVAEALVRHRPLRHSVLFLFPAAEERGLLGSDYYVTHPLWPLNRTAAVINLDAGAPPGLPVSWRLAGVDSAGLGGLAIAVADGMGWQVRTSAARPNSDYFPFHREGVPAVFIIPGSEPYDGLSSDSSNALRRRWDHYHRASDHWSDAFPFGGLGRYAEFALRIVLAAGGDSTALDPPPRR